MIFAPSPVRIPSLEIDQTAWLERFLTDMVVESTAVEYKDGRALQGLKGEGSENVKSELTKDVTAMANGNGGVIIYGIAEKKDSKGVTRPKEFTRVPEAVDVEQLELILATQVKPPIAGLVIKAIEITHGGNKGDACIAIEVPMSSMPHQAKDGKYYRRRNATIGAMNGYEVIEVLNRRRHPEVSAAVSLHWNEVTHAHAITMNIIVSNQGSIPCDKFFLRVTVPCLINGAHMGLLCPWEKVKTTEGWGLQFTISSQDLTPGIGLLPGMSKRFTVHFTRNSDPHWAPHEERSIDGKLLLEIWADSMPSKMDWYSLVSLKHSGDSREVKLYMMQG